MPTAYHNVFFVARKDATEGEVVGAFTRFRDAAVERGYVATADDLSIGKVVLPSGSTAEEVERARGMTGGFDWGVTVRLDGADGLARYLAESPADIEKAGLFSLFMQPIQILIHDHIDQS